MPTETGRVVGRKQVKIPNGGTVDCPVITKITFQDPVDRYQETQYTIDNSSQSNRDTHVASIPGGGQSTDESGNSANDLSQLQVQRIDLWRVRDPVDRYQDTYTALDNKTVQEPPNGVAPPYPTPGYFTTHEKTHLVKYINTPDDGGYVVSELIDKIKVQDPVDRYQETEYSLQNPPDNQNISGITIVGDDGGNQLFPRAKK